MVGSFPKPVHANVTASIQACQGLSHREDVYVFVSASLQLHAGFSEACSKAETFVFVGASLLTVKKL